MTDASNRDSVPPSRERIGELLGALAQIAVFHDTELPRSDAQLALEEAAATWPGRDEGTWWRWLREAASGWGIRLNVLDCAPADICLLVARGACVVAPTTEGTVVATSRGRRFRIHKGSENEPRELSKSRLLKLLGSASSIRILYLPGKNWHVAPTASLSTPWGRLKSLLKAEWSDIWILLTFALVVGIMTLATPIAVEALVNTVAFGRALQPVVILATILFGFLAFAAGIRALQNWVVEIIQRRLFARIAGELAWRLPRIEWSRTDRRSRPELVNRFFDVVTIQKVSAQLLLDGIALLLGAFIGMTVLAFYHPWLLAFDSLLLLMIVVIIFGLGRGAVSSSIQESKGKYETASWLEDLANCEATFKHAGAADMALARTDALVDHYLSRRRKHFRILFRQILFALILQAVASTVLLGLGGWLVISGELTLGQLVAAELIVTVIVGSFAKLGKHMESFYDLLASVDKLGVLFDLPLESQHGALNTDYTERNAELQLTEVAVHPSGRKISLTAKSGDRVAVVGSSGTGKTALTRCLFGMEQPNNGSVEINGVDIRDLRSDVLRQHCALVADVEVFDGTIAENVSLGRPGVTHQEIRAALETVGVLEDVLRLSEGLETRLSPAGEPLSGSQILRVMLARAIAGRPRILIVDGALDYFCDEETARLTEKLFALDTPEIFLIVTGRGTVKERCSTLVTLN